MIIDSLPSVISVALATGAAAGGLASFMFQTWWKSRVDSASQRALAEFKHQLDSATEAARFEYQRRIADFNRFAEKRHESYAELWQLIRIAHGRILDIGRIEDHGFEYYDEDDVEQRLRKEGVPSGKRNEILTAWRQDRLLGVRALNEILASMVRRDAEHAYVAANNSFVANELYLSSSRPETQGRGGEEK